MFDVTYIAPDGRVIPLTGGDVEIVEAGIQGLTGAVKDIALSAPGLPGQVLDGHIIEPCRGRLELLVDAERAEQVALAVRSAFQARQPGRLIMMTRLGEVSIRIRRDGQIDAPVDVNSGGRTVLLTIPVIADDGVWHLKSQQGQGRVVINNPGDTAIYPTIQWTGSNQHVIMPSGARCVLPTVQAPKILHTAPEDFCMVTNPDGSIDRHFSGSVDFLPEGVPPGDVGIFTGSNAVTIEWQAFVLDPWR